MKLSALLRWSVFYKWNFQVVICFKLGARDFYNEISRQNSQNLEKLYKVSW